MILVPALAVVQILRLRVEQERNNATALRLRQEVNLQCQELVETCQAFASGDGNAHECDKLIEYGKICLYLLPDVAS
jgi:hypothetical protein